MSFAVETVSGDDLKHGGGATLAEPGWYHVNIENVKDGLLPNNTPVNGFTIEIDVLAGKPDSKDIEPSEFVGKKLNLIFNSPDKSKSEKAQKMTRRQNTNFLIATDLTTPSQLGASVDINPVDATGRHLIIHLERKQEKNEAGEWVDTKFLRIAYADVFHIDDPEVAAIPKNVAALKYIKSEHRHDAKYFAFKAKNGQTDASGSAPGAPRDVDV